MLYEQRKIHQFTLNLVFLETSRVAKIFSSGAMWMKFGAFLIAQDCTKTQYFSIFEIGKLRGPLKQWDARESEHPSNTGVEEFH